MTAESKGSIATVMDIYALSMIMLSARAARGVSPAGSVMQLFGVIGHLEESKLLEYVDESCWRAMMVACGSVNAHDFGHMASCVLFETMKSSVKSIDALAYVQYCQSFSRKIRDIPENMLSYWDPFCFLEQLGLAWFAQKSTASVDRGFCRENSIETSPMPSGQLTPVKTQFNGQMTPPSDISRESQSPGTPKSGSNIWRLFKGGKRDVTAVEAAPVFDDAINKPLMAYQDVATVLHLEKPIACYGLSTPKNDIVGLISKHADATLIPDEYQWTDAHIDTRVNELRELCTRMRRRGTADECATAQARHVVEESTPITPKGSVNSLFP